MLQVGHVAVAGETLCPCLLRLGSSRLAQGCFVGHMEW